MSEYTGEKCIICDNEFTDNDDIVVCPDCGTPYHRECYAKEGKCVNTELHSSGLSWKKERMKKIEEQVKKSLNDENVIKCPHCNNINPPTSHFCAQCGSPINTSNHIPNMNDYNQNTTQKPANIFNIDGVEININDKCCGFNPDEDFDGIKLSEIADYVGSNQLYYIPMFKKMKDTGRKLFLNFTCIFFPQYFFANRKCYFLSIISIILMFIISIPTSIETLNATPMFETIFKSINTNSDLFQNLILLTTILMYAFRLIFSLFGNWFYYNHTIKKIKEIKDKNQDVSEEVQEIKTYGGIRPINIIFAVIMEVFLQFGILYLFKFI